MTVSNETLNRPGYCERIESFGQAELLRMGLDGTGLAPNATETALGITAGDIAAQMLELATKGFVTFRKGFTCSTNDAVALEMVARGMTAAAGSWRRLDTIAVSGDDAGIARISRSYGVLGAATPVLDEFPSIVLMTAGLPADVDIQRTVAAATEAQTFATAAGSGTGTVTYTGQSGDVTTGFFEVRVYPKQALTLV